VVDFLIKLATAAAEIDEDQRERAGQEGERRPGEAAEQAREKASGRGDLLAGGIHDGPTLSAIGGARRDSRAGALVPCVCFGDTTGSLRGGLHLHFKFLLLSEQAGARRWVLCGLQQSIDCVERKLGSARLC